jgi:indole-3-glycerol phosphate synthase
MLLRAVITAKQNIQNEIQISCRRKRYLIMDLLAEILADKQLRLAQVKAQTSLKTVREQACKVRAEAAPHAFSAALSENERINIIAEIKRASPSRGMIRAHVEPVKLAREYEAGGAAAISVLTEEARFRGALADLCAVRGAVSVPVLRKDFIFDEYQVYEAAAAGADALLLIVAALDDQTLARLRRITEDELGMDALVEVHTREEMRCALLCNAKTIGVNNRDLRTFNVSLDTSLELIREATENVLCVSESGLRDGSDLAKLSLLGYKAFLIGETLMRADEPGKTLRALLDEAKEKMKER